MDVTCENAPSDAVLRALVGRLYGRCRARGLDAVAARESAAGMAAEMLGCDLLRARAQMGAWAAAHRPASIRRGAIVT
jgi:hypothetical protein